VVAELVAMVVFSGLSSPSHIYIIDANGRFTIPYFPRFLFGGC
jgi:hypothetical protein